MNISSNIIAHNFIQYSFSYEKEIGKIFEKPIIIFDNECRKLAQLCSEQLPVDQRYAFIPFPDTLHFITATDPREATKTSCTLYQVPQEYMMKYEDLVKFYTKLKQDIAFIQQWFSLFIKEDSIPNSFIKYPFVLRQLLGITSNEPYEIPKGKESFWHKAEDTLNYYAGLQLIL